MLDRHRRRYDSHVAHLFEGLFKSQVSCPTCETVSVTFDPYMSVAVPLGAAGMRVVHATLRRSDGAMQPLALVGAPSTLRLESLARCRPRCFPVYFLPACIRFLPAPLVDLPSPGI